MKRIRWGLVGGCFVMGSLFGWAYQSDANCGGELVPRFPWGLSCVEKYREPIGTDDAQFKEWFCAHYECEPIG